MRRPLAAALFATALHAAAVAQVLDAPPDAAIVRVAGLTAARSLFSDANKALADRKVTVEFVAAGQTALGIEAVGRKAVDIGVLARPLTGTDSAKFPRSDFREIRIGEQATAFVVSSDVWKGGVRALSAEQARDLYRKTITHWNALGGPETRITFFLAEEGKGTFELFANWAFGSVQRVPLGRFETVADPDEAKNSVEFTASSAALMPPTFANGTSSFALGIIPEDGTVIEPTLENIRDRKWPMSRPLYLLVEGRPVGGVRTLVEFFFTEKGEALLRAHGFIPARELGITLKYE